MKTYTEQDAEQAIYAIYLRKSRADLEAERRGEGETLARHEKILTAVAEEQGLKIGKIYKELVSGETIQARPQMQELLREINAGKYTGVLVVAADRLSRGDLQNMGMIINALKFSNTQLITPAKIYDVANNKFDEQMLEMQLFNSKQEYRAIVGRMHEGRLLSIREGNYISGVIPLGYDLDTPDRYTRTLKPNKDAELIQRVFKMVVEDRMSFGRIAHTLTTEGIKPPRAKEWYRETIRDIVRNPVYIGKVRWKRIPLQKEMDENGKIIRRHRHNPQPLIVNGKHPSIISQDVWDEAQILTTRSTPSTHTKKELKNPLASILVCKKCGKAIKYHYKGYTTPRYYHKDSTVCKTSGVTVNEILELITQTLNKHIEDFSFKVNNSDKMEEASKHASEVESLEREIKTAQSKRNKLFDDYDDGVYTKEEFAERKIVWAERISKISKRLEVLRNTKPVEVDYEEKVIKFSRAVESLKNPEISPQAKNDLLREVIDRIEFDATGKGKTLKITLDIHIKD